MIISASLSMQKVLLMRCNNLIRNRLLLKSRLTKQVDFDVQLLATTSLDQQLFEPDCGDRRSADGRTGL